MTLKATLAFTLLSISASALAGGPLQVTSTAMVEAKSRAADGTTKVSLVPAVRVVPGDRVVFLVRYRNVGDQPLGNLAITNSVPSGLSYRAPADGSPAPNVSVDGQTWGPLATLRISDPAGVMRPATADDVRHLRWRLARPLTAGAQGQFAYSAVLK